MTEPDVTWPPAYDTAAAVDECAIEPVWLTPPPEPDPED